MAYRKIPWRLSKFQKARHRERLRAVDAVVATVDQALAKKGETLKSLEVWKETMPSEAEMLPKDKYTMFDRKEKRYRKGIHSKSLVRLLPLLNPRGIRTVGWTEMLILRSFAELPKWTRVSQRLNPPGY